ALDRDDCRDGGMRDGEHQIAFLNFARPKRELDRIGAARDADAELTADVTGELSLERFDLRPEDVPPASCCASESGIDFRLLLEVRCPRIRLRNPRGRACPWLGREIVADAFGRAHVRHRYVSVRFRSLRTALTSYEIGRAHV